MDAHMERMMKMMNQDFTGSKRILELNFSHPLIKNLAQLNQSQGDEALIKNCILQLYEGALLVDGNTVDPPTFVARMTEIMERATS